MARDPVDGQAQRPHQVTQLRGVRGASSEVGVQERREVEGPTIVVRWNVLDAMLLRNNGCRYKYGYHLEDNEGILINRDQNVSKFYLKHLSCAKLHDMHHRKPSFGD